MEQPGRREERFPTELLLTMDGGTGLARNVSASGIYFETDAQLTEGSSLRFTMDFGDSPGGPLRLDCEARIVRVEQRGTKMGVGAAIQRLKFAVVEGQP